MAKKFDLMHWWVLLKDQYKSETFYDQSAKASSKHLRIKEAGGILYELYPSTPSTLAPQQLALVEDTPNKEVGELNRPSGRKAAKRKVKLRR